MLLLSPYGYVSRWGVRFWFQNRYFKGNNGYLSLRHSHMFFFNVWNLAGLLSFWIYIYIYTFFEVAMSKKKSPLWREAHLQVKMLKALGVRTDVQISFRVAGARDCAPCQKWAKRNGFVAFSKTMAGVGHLKRICKDAFRLAGAVREICSSEMLGGQGADFLRGVAFWSIRYVDFLRWFCATGAALRMTWHLFFVAGAVLSTGGVEKSHNALVRGRQRCTQLSIFEGSLAELLRFGCSHVQK